MSPKLYDSMSDHSSTIVDPSPFSWLAEWGFIITALIAVVLFALNRFLTFFGEVPLKDQLQNRHLWPDIIEQYSINKSEVYISALEKLHRRVGQFYGEDAFGSKAFLRCLQLALLYPIFSILSGWVFGDGFSLGGLIDLPQGYELFERMWRVSVMLIVLFSSTIAVPVLNWGLRKMDSQDTQLKLPKPIKVWSIGFWGKVFRELQRQRSHAAARSGTILVMFSVVALPISLVMVASNLTGFPSVLAGLMAIAGIAAATNRLTVRFVSAFFFIMFPLLILLGPYSSEQDAEFFSVTLLVFCIFPLFNALADWLSIGTTRHLVSKISSRKQRTITIIFEVVVDVFAAVIYLISLLVFLILLLELWGMVIPAALSLNWRTYLLTVVDGSPGHATPLFLMATTTLLPSFVHLIYGLAALATAQSWSTKEAIRIMKAEIKNETAPPINTIVRHLRRGEAEGYIRSFLVVGGPFLALFLVLSFWK